MTITNDSATRPNPEALAALAERLNWFLAKREVERREFYRMHSHQGHWVGLANRTFQSQDSTHGS